MPTIGQRMMAQRKRLGLSMKTLAQELGVCEKTIHNWEHDIGVFPVDLLIPTCLVLGLSPRELLGEPPLICKNCGAAVRWRHVSVFSPAVDAARAGASPA